MDLFVAWVYGLENSTDELSACSSGFGWSFAVLPYGDAWRARRRKFHQYFREQAVQEYCPLQSMQSIRFLRDLHAHPEDFYYMIRKWESDFIYLVSHRYDNDAALSDILGGLSYRLYMGSKMRRHSIIMLLWTSGYLKPFYQSQYLVHGGMISYRG